MNATSRIFQSAGTAVVKDRVFAAPVNVDGVTVIAASRISGRGGGGEHSDEGDRGGGGFGVIARPVGAIVIDRGRVRWKPAVDVTRIVLGGQLVGIAYFVASWLVARSSARAAIGAVRVE